MEQGLCLGEGIRGPEDHHHHAVTEDRVFPVRLAGHRPGTLLGDDDTAARGRGVAGLHPVDGAGAQKQVGVAKRDLETLAGAKDRDVPRLLVGVKSKRRPGKGIHGQPGHVGRARYRDGPPGFRAVRREETGLLAALPRGKLVHLQDKGIDRAAPAPAAPEDVAADELRQNRGRGAVAHHHRTVNQVAQRDLVARLKAQAVRAGELERGGRHRGQHVEIDLGDIRPVEGDQRGRNLGEPADRALHRRAVRDVDLLVVEIHRDRTLGRKRTGAQQHRESAWKHAAQQPG